MQSAWSNPKPMGVCASVPSRPRAVTALVVGAMRAALSRAGLVEVGRSAVNSTESWRQLGNPGRLTILLWVYIAQAVAGSVIGFTAPFLYYFGVL